jgi:protein-tyrosine phosphatase
MESVLIAMIDFHNHILPGIDDGSSSISESIAMAKILVELGYNEIHCTPHIMSGFYNNNSKTIKNQCQKLQQHIYENKIDLKLIPGFELYLDETYKKKMIDCEDIIQKEILVEGPIRSWPDYLDMILIDIIERGYIPIIAHPERNIVLQKDLSYIKKYRTMGCEIQCNILSMFGTYGKREQNYIEELLVNNLVNYLGTDMHSAKVPISHYQEAFSMIRSKVGNHGFMSLTRG